MRVLILGNFGGDGELDLAMRSKAAGHATKFFYAKTERTKDFGRGLVDIVDDWRPWMRWADLVILADNTKYLREVDAWRMREGIKVIGATQDAAAWELDRLLGQKVLKKAGVDTIPCREFKNYDEAIAYVKRENKRFVCKPSGAEPDKSLSYVSKGPADMVYMLERWKKAKKLKAEFVIQDFVPGTEMAVGGWFGPGGFNEGWCENWEFKALMAGDTGPNCGELGTILRYVKRSKLADMVLKPVEDGLYDLGYCGYVDVNCIIDEHGTPWPLEFTMRFGWPTFNIQQALHEGDPIEWLVCLADGQDARRSKLNKIACGVCMCLPDHPYSKEDRATVTGVPVYGITEAIRDHIHPCEMMQGEAPAEVDGKIMNRSMMVTSGDYVLVVTGVGDTVTLARKKAYAVMGHLKAPSSPFWRPDIGMRLKKQLPEIQKHGFATAMSF